MAPHGARADFSPVTTAQACAPRGAILGQFVGYKQTWAVCISTYFTLRAPSLRSVARARMCISRELPLISLLRDHTPSAREIAGDAHASSSDAGE